MSTVLNPESLIPAPAGAPRAPDVASPQDLSRSRVEAMIASGLGMGDKPQNTPGELAAAGGEGSKPTTHQWTDGDLQAAQAYLGRDRVPLGLLDGKASRDEIVRWALDHVGPRQKNLDAKLKAKDGRISELETLLVKAASGANKAPTKGDKPKVDPRAAALRELFKDVGADESKIESALELLIPTAEPEAEPKPDKQSDEALREVRALAVQSARTQLSGMYPALQHDALYSDILDDMQSLNGPRYNALQRGERELAKMRDACMLRFGAPKQSADPDKTQARDQVLRAQPSSPQGGKREQPGLAGKPLAANILAAHGYQHA